MRSMVPLFCWSAMLTFGAVESSVKLAVAFEMSRLVKGSVVMGNSASALVDITLSLAMSFFAFCITEACSAGGSVAALVVVFGVVPGLGMCRAARTLMVRLDSTMRRA